MAYLIQTVFEQFFLVGLGIDISKVHHEHRSVHGNPFRSFHGRLEPIAAFRDGVLQSSAFLTESNLSNT